jgi:hypothetical protein
MGGKRREKRVPTGERPMSMNIRVRAVLNLQRKSVPVLLARSKCIYNGLAQNQTQFPAPNPPLPTLLSQIQDLDKAQQATSMGTRGTVIVRNTKVKVLVTSLECEQVYVQTLCDANPPQAVLLIQLAAMAVGKTPSHTKPILQAKLGRSSGMVILTANAGILVGSSGSRRVTFNWQSSADGGKTWTSAPSTPLATTVFTNLMPLLTYAVRVSVTTSKGTGAWSPQVAILVA